MLISVLQKLANNMKKILVIGSVSTDQPEIASKEQMVSYIATALETAGEDVEVSGCFLDEVGYVVNNETAEIHDLHNNKKIDDYDVVYFRGKLRSHINDAALIASFLTGKRTKVLTSAYKNRRATGKVPQMYQLQALGYPIPYSVSASTKYLPGLISEHLTYPIILKDMHGGHGNDNFLVKDEEQLKQILEDRSEIRFIAQEFIANDGDYRILCIGDKTLVILRKGSDDSHLNNTSQGASAELVALKDFPEIIIEQARNYASQCQYEIAGVDVMFAKGTDKHYFLEINSQPQLMTGAFVEEKQILVGEYLKELLDQSA